jgi:hypothetical protein
MCIRDIKKVMETENDDKSLIKIQQKNLNESRGIDTDGCKTTQPLLGHGWMDVFAVYKLDSHDYSEYWNYL